MFTATTDTGSVTWDHGALTGDEALVRAVEAAIPGTAYFDYWGEREASLADEFSAYITVGYALQSAYGDVTISPVPDNPDGYEEEGAWPDAGTLLAGAYERHTTEHFHASGGIEFACYDRDCRPPNSGGTGGSKKGRGKLPTGNTETWARKKAKLLGMDDELPPEVKDDIRNTARKFRAAFFWSQDGDMPEVRIRVPFSAIKGVAAKGFQSQHDSATSGGLFDPTFRKAVEERMFSAKDTKPIYGYTPTERDHAEGFVTNYGQLAVVLTPEAAARTTVTRGDSLVGGSARSNGRYNLDALPAPVKLSEVHKVSDERLYMASPEDNSRHNDGIVNYFETQTHGGVRPEDIAKIIMPYLSGDEVRSGSSKWQGYSVEKLQKLFPNAIIEVAHPYTAY